jgi:(p)ppGpp synthase/HD superfamily hydrolase
LRVTIRILSHYRVTDADVACAALLHDAVEDHADDIAPRSGRETALAVLAGQFGERAAELVAAVTNPVYEPGRDKHEQYREHVIASLQASPWARVIKVSDFTDNAVASSTPPGRSCPSWPGSTVRWCHPCAISSFARTRRSTPTSRT